MEALRQRVGAWMQGRPYYASATDPVRWLSVWLQPQTLLAFAILSLSMIGGIIFLCIRDVNNHGIVSVDVNGEFVVVFVDFGISLLWTFLPTLIVQIYSIILTTIVMAACARQPYVELTQYDATDNKIRGAPAEKSILLDYCGWFAPKAIWRAFKYGHFMLFFALLVSLLVQLLLTPISSHLFETATTGAPHTKTISRDTQFDMSALAFGAQAPFSTILDTAAAIQLYGAGLLPWTTGNATLLPLDLSRLELEGQPFNVSAATESLSMSLDCRVLSKPHYILQYSAPDGAWQFSGEDRQCTFLPQLYTSELSGHTHIFANTFRVACDANAGTSRLISAIALDQYGDRSGFSNETIVSCIPTYLQGHGTVNILFDQGTSTLQSYTNPNNKPTYVIPGWALDFETQLQEAEYTDPTLVTQGDVLGTIVVNLAQKLSPDEFMQGDIMQNATQAIWTSAFNIMAQRFLIKSNAASNVTAVVYEEVTRLRVVLPVAYAMVGVFFVVALQLLWIGVYTAHHPSAQSEEPEIFLGPAIALYGSTIAHDYIPAAKKDSTDGVVGETVKNQLKEQRLGGQGWTFRRWDGNPKVNIILSTKVRRPLEWYEDLVTRWRNTNWFRH